MDVNHKFKYGIVAVNRDLMMNEGNSPIYHFCGYEVEPTFESFLSLYRELNEDSEFGLTEIIDDLVLVPANEEMMDEYLSGAMSLDEEECECRPTITELYGNG